MYKDIQDILQPLKKRQPDAQFKSALKERLRAYILAYPASEVIPTSKIIYWHKVVRVGTAALLIVVVSGTGTVFASQMSLPGEPLYPVKLWSDSVRISLSRTKPAAINTRLDVASRRLAEIQEIIEKSAGEQKPATATENDIRAALIQYENHLQNTLQDASEVTKTKPKEAKQALDEAKQKINQRTDQLEEIGKKNNNQEIQNQVRAALIRTLELKRDVNNLERTILPAQKDEPEGTKQFNATPPQGGRIKDALPRKEELAPIAPTQESPQNTTSPKEEIDFKNLNNQENTSPETEPELPTQKERHQRGR